MTTKPLRCSALLLALLLAHSARAASVPPLLPFSAVVRVDGTNFSGPIQLKFTIVAIADPDNNLWANDGTGMGEPAQATAATALDGACRIHLGDTNLPHMRALPPAVFASTAPLALRVWLQAGSGPLEQLDPDTPLLPAPFAFNSALLDGYAPQAFASTAATCQLAADLAAVTASLPSLSNAVLAVRSALAVEVTNRVQAGAALSNLLAAALLAHSVTAEFALASLMMQINGVSDQLALASTALASNLVAEAALRTITDTSLAAEITASSSATVALVEHTRADLAADTDAATNAVLGSALIRAYAAASNLSATVMASNQQWVSATFLNKNGDAMFGPLRVAQILMCDTIVSGYLAAGIAAQPEANGFYCHNGQTTNDAPVFGNAAGVLLYRYRVDDLYDWRIGPNLSGTPAYAMQSHSQETLPPVTQWNDGTLSAAVWTNNAVIDFAGGAARNLAPATNDRDAATYGQLVAARDGLTAIYATINYVDTATNSTAILMQNNYLNKFGDSMAGPLTLAGAPTTTNQAATKGYVDALSNASSAAYVTKSGGSISGPLYLGAPITAASQAVSKAYVDAATTATVASAAGTYVKKTGDSMCGALNIDAHLPREGTQTHRFAFAALGLTCASASIVVRGQPGENDYEFCLLDLDGDWGFSTWDEQGQMFGDGLQGLVNRINNDGTCPVSASYDYDEMGTGRATLFLTAKTAGNAGNTITYTACSDENIYVNGQWADRTSGTLSGGTEIAEVTRQMRLTRKGLTLDMPLDMNAQPIINVAAPTNASDAATKLYVDTQAAGFTLATNTITRAEADVRYVNASGDTVSGQFLVTGAAIGAGVTAAGIEGGEIYLTDYCGVPLWYIDDCGGSTLLRVRSRDNANCMFMSTDGHVGIGMLPAGEAVAVNGNVFIQDTLATKDIRVTGALTMSGAGDWQVGSAQTRADIILKNAAAQIRSDNGDVTLAAAANHSIRMQSFTQLSAEQFGQATIPTGTQEVQVTGKPVTASAVILLTPCAAVPGAPYAQIDGTTFWIKLPAPATQDTAINYVILNR